MKFIIPIILGAFISFALFALMASLVGIDEVKISEVDEFEIITIVNQPEDSEIKRKKRILDPPPKPKQMPDGVISMGEQPQSDVAMPKKMAMPEVSLNTGFENQEFAIGVLKDSAATPIYRSLPRYPIEAARQKVKGWVKLKFSINRDGGVENIEVLDSLPPVIFDQAAIDALNRWKYKAKLEKGKTVRQENLSVRIDFGKK